MRTITLSLTAALIATAVAGCTVKDVDTPDLAGPSSLARTILMTVDRDTLIQDGQQEAAIQLRALVQPGQSENVRLQAQVFVDGVAQDFGTLSNKSPITPTTIFFRAPAAPTTVGGQTPTTVTIGVTPVDSGDFRGEVMRTVDIRLVPPGIILPTNPNLIAAFTVTPEIPKVMDTTSFNATSSTNGGSACLTACTYAWNFGDGTTAAGMTVTHQFRSAGIFLVTLAVTDNRGAQAQAVRSLTVEPGTPPTVPSFQVTPTPAAPNSDVFFNASAAQPAPGRRIVSYNWNFGDGSTGSGVTTSHRFGGNGIYSVTLTVTDDAGSVTTVTQAVTISNAGNPTAQFTVTPGSPKPGQVAVFNASASTPGTGATIVEYRFNYGDGHVETTTNPIQSHTYATAGTYIASVTVTDSLGRSATRTAEVIVAP